MLRIYGSVRAKQEQVFIASTKGRNGSEVLHLVGVSQTASHGLARANVWGASQAVIAEGAAERERNLKC